jgi:glycosyltransferase involved in cell wall biosynthesis
MLYFKAIRKVPGITAAAIPLYLPPDSTTIESGLDSKVFFGAISMYLREKVPMLRKMPAFIDKFLNASPLLKIAARRAGTTRTEGLEKLTLNMIKGDNAFRQEEIDRLVNYLISNGKPDIVHLSNALIIGLAHQLKKRLDVKIICSLLNEDDWIDEMAEPYRGNAWKLISEEAGNVDAFITPSRYYKDLFINKTGLSGDNIHIVPIGIESENPVHSKENIQSPSVGYFCRVSYQNGFDKLVDAFIELKSSNMMPGITLHVCGGFTGDDKPFIREQIKKIKDLGFESSVRIYTEFQGNAMQEFFKNIDIMSVPVRKHDGYGLYILEANAAGVPVVQPATGAFPEIIEMTKGGITYSPDNISELSSSLFKLLNEKNLRAELGEKGKNRIREEFTLEKMSQGLSDVYGKICTER